MRFLGAPACPQDLYSGMPVPEVLADGDGAASFAFLEKELRFAAPAPA